MVPAGRYSGPIGGHAVPQGDSVSVPRSVTEPRVIANGADSGEAATTALAASARAVIVYGPSSGIAFTKTGASQGASKKKNGPTPRALRPPSEELIR